MKHLLTFLSLVATVSTATLLKAGQIGLSWSYSQRGNEVILKTKGLRSVLTLTPSNAKCDIDIPAEMKGVPVVEIGDNAFYNHTSVTNFTIPNGIKKIGKDAFYNCTSITTLTIPEGVTTIGDGAFYGCRSLTTVILPKSLTSIGKKAFYNCSSITTLTIPKGVTTIGEHAFAGCERLSSINLPKGIKTIQAYTFQNCKSLTSIDIPETVTIIQKDAFYNTAIKDLIIPEGVVEIEDGAFNNVKLDTLSLPKSLKKIGLYSFATNYKEYIGTLTPGNVDCYAHYATKDKNVFKGLSHSCPMVDLPKTVRFIDTFGSVGSLKKITLNEGLIGICDRAFQNTTSLLVIEFPNTVETIGKGALNGQNQILTFEGTPPAIKDLGRNCEVRYYAKHAAAWIIVKNKRPWKDAKLVEIP